LLVSVQDVLQLESPSWTWLNWIGFGGDISTWNRISADSMVVVVAVRRTGWSRMASVFVTLIPSLQVPVMSDREIRGTVSGVLAPGDKLRRKGLTYAATPASDFICGTLQLAAGMNLHVFTTGRVTPYGLAAVPVIKVATRSELARRWHDLMDVNAGAICDGTASHER